MKTQPYTLFSLLLAVTILLAACGGSAAPATPTPAPTATAPAPTATASPSSTPLPPTATATNTPAPPTLTPTATSTPTTTPTATDTATPAPTDTPIPPSPTPQPPPPTPTRKPPTATPTPQPAAFRVEWIGNLNIEPRAGTSNWCQVQMIYYNQSVQNLPWPDYRPVISIAAPGGNIVRQRSANYYSKDQGWPNGIEGLPPTIPAGKASFMWTWYTATVAPGEYCRYIAVQWQGVTYTAEYDLQGKLINSTSTTR